MIVQVRPDGWSASVAARAAGLRSRGAAMSRLRRAENPDDATDFASTRRSDRCYRAGDGRRADRRAVGVDRTGRSTRCGRADPSGERVRAYLAYEADHFFIGAFLIVGMLRRWRWWRRCWWGGAPTAGLGAGRRAQCRLGGRRGRRRGRGCGPGALALRDDRHGRGADISPEHRVHYVIRGARGVLRAFAAADRDHDPVSRSGCGLVYALIAVSTSRDDLGAWPPVEEPPPATDRTRTAVDASTRLPVITFALITASRTMPR